MFLLIQRRKIFLPLIKLRRKLGFADWNEINLKHNGIKRK